MAAGRHHALPRVPLMKTWLLGAVVVACTAAALSASDGRIPIGTAPYSVNAPGSYYLTADLVGSGGSVVTISSSGVSLDLNGHYIWQGSTATGTSCISSSGYAALNIFNGTLVGGYYGIYFPSVPAGAVTLDHLILTSGSYREIWIQASGSSPGSQPGVQVTNNTLSLIGSTQQIGIWIQGALGGRVAGNTVTGPGTSIVNTGIFSYQSTALLIEDNSIGGVYYGIQVNSSNGVMTARNSVTACYEGIGHFMSNNCHVEDNVASNNTYGIFFNTVSGCIYRSNAAQGNSSANYTTGAGTIDAGGNY